MIAKTFTLAVFTAAFASAFSPVATRPGIENHALSYKQQKFVHSGDTLSSSTTLFMNNDKPDELKGKSGEFQERFEDSTKFLVVDIEKARQDLAKNWGWIVGSGVLTMALGALALTLPVAATGVAYDGTVLTIGSAGMVGLVNLFFAEKGHKLKSGISGLGYSALAYYMATHPAAGLDIITLTIATVIAAEGFYEVAVAARNENIQGRGWHFVSGVISSIAGFALSANIPAASLVTPGAALGVRLTSNGASKVAIGLTGKDIADKSN